MRLYEVLLHLYPAAFRAEYGGELCAVFEQRLRDASSPLATFAVWLDAFLDTVFNAARVHLDILWQDLRYEARALARAPGFTATAVAVAALGIGATTAAFSLADHVLIRPLPFVGADRLVDLWEDQSFAGYSQMEPSPPNYRDWKSAAKSFEAMAAFRGLSQNMVGDGEPEYLEGASVEAGLFPLLGAHAALGRVFSADDDREGAPGTLLLSNALWKQRFGGDPGVLGRKVLLDSGTYTIIGVMPANFYYPSRESEIWTPMRFAKQDFADRRNNYLHVIAKLRPGVSLEAARAEMRVVAAQLQRAYPKDDLHVGINVIRLRDELSERMRVALGALVGASLCVLLIACANLANLLMARALVRGKELAVRTAMGAGRERLVRQLLTESLLLALFGGALGVLLAYAALPLLARLVPTSLPISEVPAIDLRVLGFTALVVSLTGIGFGAFPALRACARSAADGLREGSRAGSGPERERLRSALIAAEIAASVVLLVSSGLLIRALWRLQATDPGFRADGVFTLRTSLPMPQYEITARRQQYYSRVLSEVRALPGVTGAAFTSFLPMAVPGGVIPVTVEGHSADEAPHRASLRFVTPGFFQTLGIPVHRGRDVAESDTLKSQWVAVVSESFVQQYWPARDPIGRSFTFAEGVRTIVGVVGDVRVRGFERDSEPQVYLPYQQAPDGGFVWYAPKDLAIRSTTDGAKLLPSIRRIVANADPRQPISDEQPLSAIVAAQNAPRLVQVRVLGAFAAIALLLAGVGIHGLLSFSVSQRAREIGIRIAVGARPGDIARAVVGKSFRLAAMGAIAGAGIAYAAARAMQALLAGVQPGDPATFCAGIGLCVLMTLAGSFWPARRAVRVDPITVMRAE